MSQQVYCNVATSNVTIKPRKQMGLAVNKIQNNRIKLGNLIREAREQKHYSQDGLAKIVKMERQQIYRIENGKSGTSKETGLKLAQALEIEERLILELIAGIDAELNPSESKNFDNVQVLLHGGQNYSDKQKEQFFKDIEFAIAIAKKRMDESKD